MQESAYYVRMASDAEWGFLTEADEALVNGAKDAATEAVSNGQAMRFVLKDGAVLEGVPKRVSVDTTNAPSSFNTPLDPAERDQFGPTEITIEIDGTTILVREIRDVAILLDR